MSIDIKIFPFLKQLKQASGKNYMLILNWHNRKKAYIISAVFLGDRDIEMDHSIFHAILKRTSTPCYYLSHLIL